MRQATLVLIVLSLTFGACGGGGSDVIGGGDQSSLNVVFTPDPANPGSANTVGLQASGTAGDLVTVAVGVTSIANLFGFSADVTYDPAQLEFLDFAAGGLLESGGNQVAYQVISMSGQVVVGASRTEGAAGGTDGPGTLVRLTFRVLQVGAGQVGFASASLLDAQAPPQTISGTQWFGGTVEASE
ncbi:MAG: hypothetical protein GY716_18980 [bacterium]|nr:hypothetical protein [bacterium]